MINANKLSKVINKFCCIFFVCCLLLVNVQAQYLAGITHKPDTSYTNYSAYITPKHDNPNIKIVEAFNYGRC